MISIFKKIFKKMLHYILKIKNDKALIFLKIKYYINLFIINLIQLNFKKIPNLPKLYLIKKIVLSEEFKKRAYEDLNIKNYKFSKSNTKYFIYPNNENYLKQIDLGWGFDRQYYIDFFNNEIGSEIKKIYQGANFRIEHIWLLKTFKNSKNVNSKPHLDGDMPGALKVMLYVDDVDEESGPFEVVDIFEKEKKTILGKSGTLIFFNQRELYHSGAPNLSKERFVITFLIYPTVRRKIFYSKDVFLNALCLNNPFSNKV